MKVNINVTIPEHLRDLLNSFVAWLNRRYPQRDLQTGKRSLWNQNDAMELILENSEMWCEFVQEDNEVERWHQTKK